MRGTGLLAFITICVLSTTHAQVRTLELRLSARNLPNSDPFGGAPDPYAIVHYSARPSDQYVVIGQTTEQDDVNKCEWPEVFPFEYTGPGSVQRIKLDIMDSDFDEDDYIGYVEINLLDIVSSFGMSVEVEIQPTGNGYVKVVGNFVNEGESKQ